MPVKFGTGCRVRGQPDRQDRRDTGRVPLSRHEVHGVDRSGWSKPGQVGLLRVYQDMTKIEWWDVCKIVCPDITWEVFEVMWKDFEHFKRRKTLQ